MKYLWFALFALVASGPAHAACNAKPVTVEAAGNTLGVFDASGKFQSELPKSALTPTATVLDCNEDLGLIQVDFGNGDTKWIDRGDLRLTFARGNTPKPVCVDAANTRASDHTEAAVSGIDPNTTQSCVPAAP
jgi:hypothetical protein